MSEEILKQIINLAYSRKSLSAISREVNMDLNMMKYYLGKARKLEEVKALLKSNLKRFQ